MSSKIILKKSSVQSKIPQPDDLSYGEVALNYADGQVYYKHTDNQIRPLIKNYTLVIGDGISTVFRIPHNFGITNVVVQVFEVSTNSLVEVGVEVVSADEVDVLFAFPPAQNAFKVVVVG